MQNKLLYISFIFLLIACNDEEAVVPTQTERLERFLPFGYELMDAREAEDFLDNLNQDNLQDFDEIFDLEGIIEPLSRFRELSSTSDSLNFSTLAYIDLDDFETSVIGLHGSQLKGLLSGVEYVIPAGFEKGTYEWNPDKSTFDLSEETETLVVDFPSGDNGVNDFQLDLDYSINESGTTLSSRQRIFILEKGTEENVFEYNSSVFLFARNGGQKTLNSFSFQLESANGLRSDLFWDETEEFIIQVNDSRDSESQNAQEERLLNYKVYESTIKNALIGVIENNDPDAEDYISMYFEAYPEQDSLYAELDLPFSEKKLGYLYAKDDQATLELSDGTLLQNTIVDKLSNQARYFLR